MSATNNNYLRPSVIYHLMDEGVATVKKLSELSGLTTLWTYPSFTDG